MKQRSRIGVGAALAALYLLLALGVQAGWLETLDASTTALLQTVIPRSFDLPFSVLSLLGSFEVTALFFVAVAFLFLRPRDALVLLVLFLLIVGIEYLGKLLIFQPGPGKALHRYVFAVSFPTGNVRTPFSFPSGHAARSAFLTVLLASIIWHSSGSARLRAVLLALVLVAEAVMLVSRPYLGEHWASDVVGGTLLGTLLALPATLAPVRFPWRGWDRLRLRSRSAERAP